MVSPMVLNLNQMQNHIMEDLLLFHACMSYDSTYLDPQEIIKIYTLLKKYECLFEGNLGTWHGNPYDGTDRTRCRSEERRGTRNVG